MTNQGWSRLFWATIVACALTTMAEIALIFVLIWTPVSDFQSRLANTTFALFFVAVGLFLAAVAVDSRRKL